MKLFIVLMVLLTAGCANTTGTGKYKYGSDNHKFLVKEYENLNPEIHFVLLKDEAEYNSARKRTLGTRWDSVSAFTLWIPETGKCTVFIKDPEWEWEPELIGHEVAHCIWGRFHKGKKGLQQ